MALKQDERNTLPETIQPDTGPKTEVPLDQRGAQALSAAEQQAFNDITRQLDDTTPAEQSDIRQREEEAGHQYVPSRRPSGRPRRGQLGKRKTLALLAGSGGIVGVIIGLFALVLPLKLDFLVQSIHSAASSIPGHAIEQRMEYVMTRWLAMRMMQAAYPGDSNLVFCGNGAILCSLGSTKYNAWFEKKLDAKLSAEGKNIKVVLNADGRTGLGGKATSFTVSLDSIDPKNPRSLGQLQQRVTKELSGHKEARRFVNQAVKKVHGRNYLMRFISKRQLYLKYGIKRFNVLPDKTAKNIAEVKANMHSALVRSTVAKLSPRAAVYVGCLSGRDSINCQKALDGLTNDLAKNIQEAEDELEKAKQSGDADAQAKAQQKLDKIKGTGEFLDAAKSAVDGATDGRMSKIISKNILSKIVTGGAILGAIDMAFSIVGAIDDNVLESIHYDRTSQNYVNFAFAEDSSPVVIADQVRAGTVDMRNLEAVTSLFDGAEASPLATSLMGYRSAPMASIAHATPEGSPVSRLCDGPSGPEGVTLPAGEMLCAMMKLVTSYTAFLKSFSWWHPLSVAGQIWNSSGGLIFTALNGFLETVTGPVFSLLKATPGIGHLIAFGEEQFGDLITWILERAMGSQDIGFGAPGTNNYEALFGGVISAVNAAMLAGQDPNGGKTMGGGGAKLSPSEIAAITQRDLNERMDDFQAQSTFAKLFNPSLEFSVARRLLSSLPTSRNALFGSLLSVPSTMMLHLTTQPTSATTGTGRALQAFGMPWYGYSDKATLQADPATYTPEFCAASAQAREASFTREPDELIPTYKKADPCALEKVIAGAIATDAKDTSSDYYIPEVGTDVAANESASSTSDTSALPPAVGKIVSPIPDHMKSQVRMSAKYGKYPRGGPHWGVDLSGGGDGSWEFVSVCDGTVDSIKINPAYANRNAKGVTGSTNYVWIKCANGVYMGYAHFYADRLKSYIKPGTPISAGTPIAPQGNQGNSTGAHLHFQINPRRPGGYNAHETVDPAAYLARLGVSLPKPGY